MVLNNGKFTHIKTNEELKKNSFLKCESLMERKAKRFLEKLVYPLLYNAVIQMVNHNRTSPDRYLNGIKRQID